MTVKTYHLAEGEVYPLDLCYSCGYVEGNLQDFRGESQGTYTLTLVNKIPSEHLYQDHYYKDSPSKRLCVVFEMTRTVDDITETSFFNYPVDMLVKETSIDPFVTNYNNAMMRVIHNF